LTYFENINLNNILFLKENYFNEIFDSLDDAKNSRSKLDYILNGEIKNIKLMDGIKLDSESELGQLIPFNLFNKFFPKLSHDDVSKILKNDDKINIINEIDEDSENEVFNNLDYSTIQEEPEYLDNNNIKNRIYNINFSNRKIKSNKLNDKENDLLSAKNKNAINIFNFNNPYNNNKYNINYNNYNIRHSKTNPSDFRPLIDNNDLTEKL